MKKLHVHLTAALLAIILAVSHIPVVFAAGGIPAAAGNIDVTLNGTNIKLGTYNIANNNYVKLRDVAQLLKGTGKEFSIAWNGPAQRIDLTSGKSYQSVGGELNPLAAGTQSAEPSSASVWLDGSAVSLTAYTISGNNFFKLRDLGAAMDFAVDWDAATSSVLVDTTKPYAGEMPAPAGDQSAMAQAMLEALNKDIATGISSDWNHPNARLADVDGDGVLELLTICDNEHHIVTVTLYDWKDGQLQFKYVGSSVGGGSEWYLCRNTVTGEIGLEYYNWGGGDFNGGTSRFYYPTREFSITDHSYAPDDDWDTPTSEYLIYESEDEYLDGEVTQAEWQTVRDENRRIEMLMEDQTDRTEADRNIASVRAQLNNML